MKNNKPAKKAAPKTAKKVEKKAVAVKKVAPSKPATPSVPQLLKEIEEYKLTCGQLEAVIDDLKQKNAKMRKRLAAYKEAKPAAPAKSPFVVTTPALGNVSVPTMTLPAASTPVKPVNQDAPVSPFLKNPSVPTVNLNKNRNGFSPVPAASSAFLKSAKATRF